MRLSTSPPTGTMFLDGFPVRTMTVAQCGERVYVARVGAPTVLIDRLELPWRIQIVAM